MESSACKGLTGAEGLLTFNFFCESLISSLHTLFHLMEDNHLDIPEKAGDLPDTLAELGTNLLKDYGEDELDLERIQQEILDFYDLAFSVNDDMAPIILKGNEDLHYYYSIYTQGINLMLSDLIHSLAHDFPSGMDPLPFINEISHNFHNLAGEK